MTSEQLYKHMAYNIDGFQNRISYGMIDEDLREVEITFLISLAEQTLQKDIESNPELYKDFYDSIDLRLQTLQELGINPWQTAENRPTTYASRFYMAFTLLGIDLNSSSWQSAYQLVQTNHAKEEENSKQVEVANQNFNESYEDPDDVSAVERKILTDDDEFVYSEEYTKRSKNPFGHATTWTARGAEAARLIPVNGLEFYSPQEVSPAKYLEVLKQLNVEGHLRYKSQGDKTFCNIFTSDVAYLVKVPLPHWWRKTENAPPFELDANTTLRWLETEGISSYGWKKVSTEEARKLANMGIPVFGGAIRPHNIGHMFMVIPSPETGPLHIMQAGRTNSFDTELHPLEWWREHGYNDPEFFVHTSYLDLANVDSLDKWPYEKLSSNLDDMPNKPIKGGLTDYGEKYELSVLAYKATQHESIRQLFKQLLVNTTYEDSNKIPDWKLLTEKEKAIIKVNWLEYQQKAFETKKGYVGFIAPATADAIGKEYELYVEKDGRYVYIGKALAVDTKVKLGMIL